MSITTYPMASLFNSLPFTSEQIALMDEFPAESFSSAGTSFNKTDSSLLNIAPFAKMLSSANYQHYGTGSYFGLAKGEWKPGFTLKVEPLGSTDTNGDYFDGIVSNAFSSEVTAGINTTVTPEQRKVMQKIIINRLNALLAYRPKDGFGFVYVDSSLYLGKDSDGVPTYAGSLLAEKKYDTFESIFYTKQSLENKAARMGLNNLSAEDIATIKTSAHKLSSVFDIPMYDLMFALPVGSAKIVLYDEKGMAHSYIEYHQKFAYRSTAKNESDQFKGLVFEYTFGQPEAYFIEAPAAAPSDRFALGWFENPRIRVKPVSSIYESQQPIQYYDYDYFWTEMTTYGLVLHYGGWAYGYQSSYENIIGNEVYTQNNAPVDDAIVFGGIDYSLLTEVTSREVLTPKGVGLPYFETLDQSGSAVMPDTVCEFGVDDGFWDQGNVISIMDPRVPPGAGNYLKPKHALYQRFSTAFAYTNEQAAVMQKVLMKRLRLESQLDTGYGKLYVSNIDFKIVQNYLLNGNPSASDINKLTKAGIYQLSVQELNLFRGPVAGIGNSKTIHSSGYATDGTNVMNLTASNICPGTLMLAFPVGDCRIAVHDSTGRMKGWLQYFQTTGIPEQIELIMGDVVL